MSGETDPNTPIRLTVGALRMVIGDIATSTKAFVTEMIAAATAPLEARIAELEARGYAGAWSSGKRYTKGQIVTYDGSAWIAKLDSVNVRPATDREHWQLMVRKGADGRDGKRIA